MPKALRQVTHRLRTFAIRGGVCRRSDERVPLLYRTIRTSRIARRNARIGLATHSFFKNPAAVARLWSRSAPMKGPHQPRHDSRTGETSWSRLEKDALRPSVALLW